MKTIQLTSFLFGIFLLLSSNTPPKESERKTVGKYGNESLLQIKLYEDNTFHYLVYKNQKKVEITGLWEMENSYLTLHPVSKNKDLIRTWNLKNNDNCIKSKKGLTIYTLCKECN